MRSPTESFPSFPTFHAEPESGGQMVGADILLYQCNADLIPLSFPSTIFWKFQCQTRVDEICYKFEQYWYIYSLNKRKY